MIITGGPDGTLSRVIMGHCSLTMEGLGITPGNQFGLIQSSERPEERAVASLFSPGGTHGKPGEFAGIGDFGRGPTGPS